MPLENNTLNDLTDTKDWVKQLHSVRSYTWSVPSDLAPVLTQGVLKSPHLMSEIVQFFTKRGAQVFDPFSGEGGILVGAAMAARLAAGCDLYLENVMAARDVGAYYGRPAGNYWSNVQGDAIEFLEGCVERMPESQDLLFTDPPFGINHGRTQDKGGKVPFQMTGDDTQDIGSFKTYEQFYEYLGRVAELSYQLLKPGAYALIWLGDRHRGGHYRVVGAEAQPYIERAGFRLKGAQHFVPTPPNVRRQVFGWGRAFVPLVDHQTLWIYRKEPS